MVKELVEKSVFDKAIKSENLVAIDFYADWCGPCKMISPKFDEFSQTMTDVEFYKVNVDNSPEIAQECNITAMPTFMFFRHGSKVEEFKGANPALLKSTLDKLRQA